MEASYSVNGKNINFENLKNIEITKKEYIDYIESIKNSLLNSNKEQMAKIY